MKFRGYISSRDLTDGSFVDQSIQNLIIRKSCEQRNFQYMLSATEYGMKNCFLMLNQVILELKKGGKKQMLVEEYLRGNKIKIGQKVN